MTPTRTYNIKAELYARDEYVRDVEVVITCDEGLIGCEINAPRPSALLHALYPNFELDRVESELID